MVFLGSINSYINMVIQIILCNLSLTCFFTIVVTLARMRLKFSHHKKAFFLRLIDICLTLLPQGMSFYSKIRSTVWSYSMNSSGSIRPSKFGKLFFTPRLLYLFLFLMLNRHNIDFFVPKISW